MQFPEETVRAGSAACSRLASSARRPVGSARPRRRSAAPTHPLGTRSRRPAEPLLEAEACSRMDGPGLVEFADQRSLDDTRPQALVEGAVRHAQCTGNRRVRPEPGAASPGAPRQGPGRSLVRPVAAAVRRRPPRPWPPGASPHARHRRPSPDRHGARRTVKNLAMPRAQSPGPVDGCRDGWHGSQQGSGWETCALPDRR